MSAERREAPAGWVGFLIDFGPLLLFFVSYRFSNPSENPLSAALTGTGVFMAAVLVAVGVSWWRFRRVSPMLWLSAILVLGFGALTIWFGDPTFIQHKPTIIYLLFAIVLCLGLLKGEALLKRLLAAAYDGLSDEGWRLLSRNWALFFLCMALFNEGLIFGLEANFAKQVAFEYWLTVKVWGVTALSLIFALANLPMMMRHGLEVGEAEDAAVPPKA